MSPPRRHRRTWAAVAALLLLPATAAAGADGPAGDVPAPRVLRVGLETGYPPFAFTGGDGAPAGISVDYLRILEQRLGVRLEVAARGDLASLIQDARDGTVDVLTSVAATPEREQFLEFTRPYFASPAVLVVAHARKEVDRLSDLAGKRVAVGRGYAVEDFLRTRHPELRLAPEPDDGAALRALLSGEVDGAVVDLASLSWIVTSTGMQGLRVLEDVGFTYEIAFASRRDLPGVRRLLDQGLASIPPAEARRIRDRWIQLEIAPPRDSSRAWSWLALAVVAAALLWTGAKGVNWALRREVTRRTRALASSEERYRLLASNVQDVIWTLDLASSRFDYVSPSILSLRGLTPEEAQAERLEDSLTPESLARVRALVARIGTPSEENPHTGIYDQPCRDGTVKHVEITTSVVREGGVPVKVVGVSRDATARVRAERELERRERHLSDILDTTQDAFWAVDVEGRIVDANPAACRMLGYTREELLQLRIGDVDAEESPEQTAERIRRVQEQGIDRFETSQRRRDGSLIRVTASVARLDAGGLMVGFFHDVTERERARRALEQGRRTLLMLTRCSEAILHATREEDLLAEVCKVIVDVGGYRLCWVGVPEQDPRRTIRRVAQAGNDDGYLDRLEVVWADTPQGRGPTGTALREGRVVIGHDFASEPVLAPWRSEALRRGFRSSTSLPLAYESERIGVLTMYSGELARFTDEEIRLLTQLADDLAFGVHALRQRAARARADVEREAADHALALEKERFQALIERSTDMTLVIDESGLFRFASPSTRAVLGYEPSELVGRPAVEFLHPDDAAASREQLRALARGPAGSTHRAELRVRRKDGSYAHVDAVRTNMLDVPAVRGIVVNSRDTSERNRIREQLQQAQKLESIGRLAGGVAHDFNNLLTIVLGAGDELRKRLLQGRIPDPALVDDILDSGRRAAELTRQLLAFARKQVVEPVPVDLNALVRGGGRMLARVLGEDVRTVLRLEPEVWPVRCDPGHVGQVIMNLAVNARDAMPSGGTLTIATENVVVAPGAPVPDPAMAPGPYVKLSVADTGVGMSPDVLAHVFEPFFTTKPAGVGTGLGLATVYGIVRQSGGFMDVRSTPGEGSTFDVYLPRDLAAAVDAGPAEPEAPRGHESVLVVEDDARVRDLLVRTLRDAGYRVIAAGGAEEAEIVLSGDGRPLDLLVTDVVMPGRGGREVARAIASVRPGVPVLYVSGYTDDALGRQGVLDPGIDLLPKPFATATLLARVRAAIDRGAGGAAAGA